MNLMSYKGYTARIEYDNEDHIFTGRIAGIRDVVGFHGSSVDELEQAFKMAPPFKTTPDKEDLITKDLLEIAGNWNEDNFKKTMSIVRRRYKSFPTIEEVTDLYWQTTKEERPGQNG